MVSIPDWSKFRGLEVTNSPLQNTTNYQKQRAQEAIKQAEEHGYFNTATESFIQAKYSPAEDEDARKWKQSSKKQKKIALRSLRIMKLSYSRLRGIGDIGFCINLNICVLSNNYISKFDSLASCIHLIKLDLHSNQIAVLPGASFWSNMSKLKILNLHDNPVGGIENLHYLAHCASLMALTLHNTPLSLKPNYRHHVVNSIWSLKALDHHVISDEEIIEDADFGGMFSALHPAFKINLCPQTEMEHEEFNLVRDVLRDINIVMAHTSPVLILQRYIRGYLLRKRYKLIHDMRIWAAVTIQRKYREWKGLPTPRTQVPPPPSPNIEPKAPSKVIVVTLADPDKLDYDTYLKNRRPGSVQLSEASARQPQIPNTPVQTEDGGDSQKKNLFINLAKLHTGGIYSAPEESVIPPTDKHPEEKPPKPRKPVVMKKKQPPPKKRIKSVKQFFGPVVETVPTPEPDSPRETSDPDEIPLINFRLRGRQENVVFYDATTEMLMSRREAGQKVRAAEDDYHGQQLLKTIQAVKPAQKSNDQRMFARIQGTMGLTCLQAIQQAYKDRERAEKRARQVEVVSNMREDREAGKERIKMYQEDRRSKVIQQRDHEQRRVMEKLERNAKNQVLTGQKYRDSHKLSAHYQKSRREDMTFIMDFSVQNTSVSNALLRHDRQARHEDRFHGQLDVVRTQREMEVEQQDVVKKYMEHRQLMRQTESAMSRAAVDTKMLQEANERLLQARSRVAHQHSRNESVNTFYPLPCVSNQPLPDIPSADKGSVSMKNFNKWNSDKLVRYNTVATM